MKNLISNMKNSLGITAFLVERNTPGLEIGKKEDKVRFSFITIN